MASTETDAKAMHPVGTSKYSDKCEKKKSFWHAFTIMVNEKI